jgi:hypothetical protein
MSQDHLSLNPFSENGWHMKIVVWGSSHWFVETGTESHERAIKVQSDVHYFTWIFYNNFQNVVSQAKEINTMKIVVDKQHGM